MNRYLVSGNFNHLTAVKLSGNLDRDFDRCKPIVSPHKEYDVYLAETAEDAAKQRKIEILEQLIKGVES